MTSTHAVARDSASVEVLLCTYNGERFIDAQIASILAQSVAVDCISVYDDGSSDDTLGRLSHWQNAASRQGVQMRIQRNAKNLGYVGNFSQALAQARGDIVFFCDQDDVWEPRKVEHLVDALRRQGCAMAFSDGVLIDADGSAIVGPSVLDNLGLAPRERREFAANCWPRLLRSNVINGAAMAAWRAPLLAALPVPVEFPHDYWLALHVARPGAITCVNRPLYQYRQHGHNVIGAQHGAWHHQLVSVWRNPTRPRTTDWNRTRVLLDHLPADDPRRATVAAKQKWLRSVLTGAPRRQRLMSVARSWLCGDYTRWSPPNSMLRDLAGILQASKLPSTLDH